MKRRIAGCVGLGVVLFTTLFRGASLGESPIRLTIFAASSLTEAFGDLERAFEGSHDGVDVVSSFAGSQVLRIQIEQGAPADVFASADRGHMQALVDGGSISSSAVFAHNELVIIVPLDNPAAVGSLTELPDARRIVIGTDNVPVGIYTRQMLQNAEARIGAGFAARVRQRVVSEESNVRLVRAKIEMGEADAAIVYRTDAAASARVRVVEIPDAVNVRADYLIGVVDDSGAKQLAESFAAFVRTPRGRAVLVRHGFVPTP